MVGDCADTSGTRTTPGHRLAATGAVVIIVALYIIPLFIPDPSLTWAAEDEACCHVRTIRAIQREGLRQAVQDYANYRSATTPLYHILMAAALDRVDPLLLRLTWVAVTLTIGTLLYRQVRDDDALHHPRRAAAALAVAFLLSPTTRASAVYFITDGLAIDLAIVSLVLVRLLGTRFANSAVLTALAVAASFASFYTRQYYLWVTLYVVYRVLSDASYNRARVVTMAECVLLALPGAALFAVWRGFTPPLGFAVHTQPVLSSTVPNALGLLALYSLPLAWVAFREPVGDQETNLHRTSLVLLVVGGMAVYIATGVALGLQVPAAGGILRLVRVFGPFAVVVFLALSYVGALMLVRWVVMDGWNQLWWAAFLLPLLSGTFLLQRYFEPAVIVFMFLVARPRDALRVLDSRLVWFYPAFTAAYAISRIIYFA